MKNRNQLIRFLGYVKPYTGYLILAAIGGIVKFTVPLLVPQVTRHLTDHVFLDTSIAVQEKIRQLFLYAGGMAAVFILVYAPFTYVRHYCSGKASHRAVFHLRYDLYYHILRLSASFFDRNKTGAIVSRLISDIELAQNLVGTALTNTWMDGFSILVVIVFLFRIDWPTATVTLVIFPVYLFFFKKFRKDIQIATSDIQDELASMAGNVTETISASVVVQAFVGVDQECKKFKHQSERLFLTNLKRIVVQSMNQTVSGTLTNIAPLVVIVFGGVRVIYGFLTVGELIAVMMYLGPLYLPMQRFSELNVVLANALAALERIFQIMDEKPDIVEKTHAVLFTHCRGGVEFRDVSFEYKHDCPVIKEVSFRVQPGEKIALVGPSGSGKTTIISLIPRFYDVNNGQVLIDGVDVRNAGLVSLRQQIGIVLQDPVLFSGSIYENILYGNPNACEEQVLRAAEAANAMEFIRLLPRGFETEVGERGILLSGGQKQRITIARAFLKDPAILILDEATSSLDSQSEKLIQVATKELIAERTTFIIAHRLSTVVRADRILVLVAGRITEQGSHAELMNNKGMYYSFYRQQTLRNDVNLLDNPFFTANPDSGISGL